MQLGTTARRKKKVLALDQETRDLRRILRMALDTGMADSPAVGRLRGIIYENDAAVSVLRRLLIKEGE